MIGPSSIFARELAAAPMRLQKDGEDVPSVP
jgi:hypothetical protein